MKPGDSLDGRYTIVQRLGAGGMGEVYKATHDFLGTPRVIKVVHPQISGSEDARDRFLREARAATKVQHPNVATLHDFASLPDGAHYMVWEFIEGENLAQRLRTRGTLPAAQAVAIAIDALRGLEAIHRAGIIHRDISPENLMIAPDDQVKIIDLGVAKVDDSSTVSQTRTGIFVGKLRYASPEQLGFLPEGETVDARADVYAMAMVIVELLTGRPPYEAKSPHEYFLLHARAQQQTTAELPPQIAGSSELSRVLAKALARDRNERFASAREFAEALELVATALPAHDALTTMPVSPAPAVETTAKNTVVHDADRTPSPAAATVRTPMPPLGNSLPTLQTPMPQAIAASRARRGFSPALVVGVVAVAVLTIGSAVLWPRATRESTTPIAATTPPSSPQQAATLPPIEAETTMTVASSPLSTALDAPPAGAPVTATATSVPSSQPAVVPQPVRTVESPTKPTPAEVEVPPPVEKARAAATEVPLYVDGGDDEETNERALELLRSELQGTRTVALRAGGMEVELVRALKEHFPEMKFEAYADVVIRFEGTMEPLGFGRKRRHATATVLKKDRVIFRYELPDEVFRVGMHPPEAFANVFAHAAE